MTTVLIFVLLLAFCLAANQAYSFAKENRRLKDMLMSMQDMIGDGDVIREFRRVK